MTIYEEVVKLAETLSYDEQICLMNHLQTKTTQHRLPSNQWNDLFDSLKINIPLAELPSLKREDWYDDER